MWHCQICKVKQYRCCVCTNPIRNTEEAPEHLQTSVRKKNKNHRRTYKKKFWSCKSKHCLGQVRLLHTSSTHLEMTKSVVWLASVYHLRIKAFIYEKKMKKKGQKEKKRPKQGTRWTLVVWTYIYIFSSLHFLLLLVTRCSPSMQKHSQFFVFLFFLDFFLNF